MKIKFVEIQNFRKLRSIRIDFSEKTTLLVGANNSGKTSAMVALGHFLVDSGRFTTNDFTLSHWEAINKIGAQWESASPDSEIKLDLTDWDSSLPSLDVWLEVAPDEIHHVGHILPTLDWAGGLLGVRLRYEPKALGDLYKDYLTASKGANDTKQAGEKAKGKDHQYTVALWPQNMRGFLDRRLRTHFALRSYLLDSTKCTNPEHGIAKPQATPADQEPIEDHPLKKLIRIDEVAAQRGLGDQPDSSDDSGGHDASPSQYRKNLSEQLRSYYSKHLDPSEIPDPTDLDALDAIAKAEKLFDERLAVGFSAALKELSTLNYPGVTDPRLKIATRMRPTDGLHHSAAVQYEVLDKEAQKGDVSLTLPEEYNGLGYQNLISIVFRLMSFRDAWMRVGRAGKQTSTAVEHFPPPLHLVLVEEPEAHLHVQVQQVFVRKAYEVLRNHDDLRDKQALHTQLIVSTHSSHVAHELDFSCLRYFRRLPPQGDSLVPISAVINLSEVFGPTDETARFVTRYLRASHCELFFADAAILVEGPAERMLVPHFIREKFSELYCCFVTLLEIGGSHAHRLRPLIEHLGLTTLIITDIDSVEATGHHNAVPPKRKAGQKTGSVTLRTWHPGKESIDDLLDLSDDQKVKQSSIPLFSIRMAYQMPVAVTLDKGKEPVEALATTFEDALVLENIDFFSSLDADGMAGALKEAVKVNTDAEKLTDALFKVIRKGDKAAFALDLLWRKEPTELQAPRYIAEGLDWLEKQLKRKRDEVLLTVPGGGSAGAK